MHASQENSPEIESEVNYFTDLEDQEGGYDFGSAGVLTEDGVTYGCDSRPERHGTSSGACSPGSSEGGSQDSMQGASQDSELSPPEGGGGEPGDTGSEGDPGSGPHSVKRKRKFECGPYCNVVTVQLEDVECLTVEDGWLTLIYNE